MKVLIISDTHGMDENLEIAIMKEAPFDYLIHCGDVEGREDYIEALADCPCYMVAGNNDYFSDLPGEEIAFIGGKKIFITHGHYLGVSSDYTKLAERAAEKGCDVAMFGHIHIPVLEEINNVLLVNPGSLSFPRQKGRKASYAVWNQIGKKAPKIEIKFFEKN